LTKQWDDRQKARELKAGLVESINIATVTAITNSLTLTTSRPDPILNRWLLSSGVIEAKIRAYFPQELLARWRAFRELVRSLPQIAAYYESRPEDYAFASLVVLTLPVRQAQRDQLLRSLNSSEKADRVGAMISLSEIMLDQVDALQTDLLSADDPDVFSTSRGDLVRDLVP